jgi:glycosyltransferase involved in cell wall biosynthesis
MKSPTRVAFILEPRLLGWTGGLNYLRNLLTAIGKYEPDLEPILFAGASVDLNRFSSLTRLVSRSVVVSPSFDERSLARGSMAIVTGTDRAIEKVMMLQGADVVFENANYFGRRFGIPALAWIPDVQHRHLPELFSRFAYMKRDMGFRLQLGPSRMVMVSSETVRRDCMSFYGVGPERIIVVPFAAPRAAGQSVEDVTLLVRKYDLPEKFLFLPNQFWKHKNHMLVCQALAILQKRGQSEAFVAASGKAGDYRHPQAFDEIKTFADSTGISAVFRLLGEIPYADLVALLRASTALLNPSLSEGWSTTVEEAKAWGVPCLVSDIPVHREQLGGKGVYFNPRSPGELADAMASVFTRLPRGPRPDAEAAALTSNNPRLKAFASGFRTAIELTLRNSSVAKDSAAKVNLARNAV